MTSSTISARNAVRRVARANWGNAPRLMLLLQSAFVVSRLMYALPYTNILSTPAPELERIHRQGLWTALCVPRGTSNLRLYKEAQALPVPLFASQRVLLQIIHLKQKKKKSCRTFFFILKTPGDLNHVSVFLFAPCVTSDGNPGAQFSPKVYTSLGCLQPLIQ